MLVSFLKFTESFSGEYKLGHSGLFQTRTEILFKVGRIWGYKQCTITKLSLFKNGNIESDASCKESTTCFTRSETSAITLLWIRWWHVVMYFFLYSISQFFQLQFEFSKPIFRTSSVTELTFSIYQLFVSRPEHARHIWNRTFEKQPTINHFKLSQHYDCHLQTLRVSIYH